MGISNHSGGVGGGHYYSYCRAENGNWYEFNDTNVSKIDESRIITLRLCIVLQKDRIVKKIYLYYLYNEQFTNYTYCYNSISCFICWWLFLIQKVTGNDLLKILEEEEEVVNETTELPEEKQVYNVSDNVFNYDEARSVCYSYNGDLPLTNG